MNLYGYKASFSGGFRPKRGWPIFDPKIRKFQQDLKKNHPKTLFLWRSNLISSSAKGQEYFMKHLLGAKSGLLAEPNEEVKPEDKDKDISKKPVAPNEKDLNEEVSIKIAQEGV